MDTCLTNYKTGMIQKSGTNKLTEYSCPSVCQKLFQELNYKNLFNNNVTDKPNIFNFIVYYLSAITAVY